MRLTCKTATGYCDTSVATRENRLQKLGPLEDIEDDLGMPLRAYHEVMKSMYCGADFGAGSGKAFYKKNGEVRKAWILQVDYCKKKVLLGDPHAETDEAVFLLSGYGETWSLRKEDLE